MIPVFNEVLVVLIPCTIISGVGCLVIVFLTAYVKGLQDYPPFFAFWVALWSFLMYISAVIISSVCDLEDALFLSDSNCQWMSLVHQFCVNMLMFWNIFISIDITMTITKPFEVPKYRIKLYHLLGWWLCLIIFFAQIIAIQIGPEEDDKITPQVVYCIANSPVFFNLMVSVWSVVFSYWKAPLSEMQKLRSTFLTRHMWLLSIFMMCWTWEMLNIASHFGDETYWTTGATDTRVIFQFLAWSNVIGVGLYGAFFSFVWGSDPVFLERVKAEFGILHTAPDNDLSVLVEEPQVSNAMSIKAVDREDSAGTSSSQGGQGPLSVSPENSLLSFGGVLRREILTCALQGIGESIANEDNVDELANSNHQYRLAHPAGVSFGSSPTMSVSVSESTLGGRKDLTSTSSSGRISPSLVDGRSSPSHIDGEARSVKNSYSITSYSPLAFRNIRLQYDIAGADVLSALSIENIGNIVLPQGGGGGNSGQFFFRTPDSRFVVKTLTSDEVTVLLALLPSYEKHLTSHPDSLLVKFFGLFTLNIRNSTPTHFVLMNNVFFPQIDLEEVYDLKGSTIARKGKEGSVMKDVDFTENRGKIYLGPEKKASIERLIELDSVFLEEHNIMDYSLLLGIHLVSEVPAFPTSMRGSSASTSSNFQMVNVGTPHSLRGSRLSQSVLSNALGETLTYHMGIIDVLQKWNLSKKMENKFKSVQRPRKASEISAVNSVQYGKRFRQFISSILE